MVAISRVVPPLTRAPRGTRTYARRGDYGSRLRQRAAVPVVGCPHALAYDQAAFGSRTAGGPARAAARLPRPPSGEGRRRAWCPRGDRLGGAPGVEAHLLLRSPVLP